MFHAVLGYSGATYFSYKYNQLTKAHSDLREVSDKKLFLYNIHQSIAEKYDQLYARREFSNKLSRYRSVLLSYAEGDVLECGIGTGVTLKYYPADQITSFIGVDWSPSMLEKSFEKIEELKHEFPFGKKQKEQGKQFFKLMQADCSSLPFADN